MAQAHTGDFINLPPFVSVASFMVQGEERIRTVIFICRMDKNVSAAQQREIIYSKENLKAIEENWAIALHWSSPGTLLPGTSVLQANPAFPKAALELERTIYSGSNQCPLRYNWCPVKCFWVQTNNS